MIDMARPWLSVAMPVHNGIRDLPATLASVAAEHPDGVEFLIYDSSPNEACRDIVARYAGQLAIRYAAVPDLRGWPDKTNLAIADASAPYVTMLHQDDLWLPGHVAALRAAIAAHPDAAMHVAGSRFIDADGRVIGRWSLPFSVGIWSGTDFGRRLIVQNVIAIPSPIFRRDAWLAVGGMDTSLWYTADWDLYLKILRKGDVSVRHRDTTAFRLHSSSLTMTGTRDTSAMREQLDVVLRRHGDFFGFREDPRLRARAETSVTINCGIAKAATGQSGWFWPALSGLLRLGPVDAFRYLYESRILGRGLPRLRARISGTL